MDLSTELITKYEDPKDYDFLRIKYLITRNPRMYNDLK